MDKEFNITGTCIPEKHYMVDTSNKLDKIFKLIEKEKYFIINRPRQYGKTTTLFLLNKKLKNTVDYLPIKISFEGIDYSSYENTISFIKTFLEMIADNLELNEKTLSDFDIDMSFSSSEISTMLESYIKDKKVSLNKSFFQTNFIFILQVILS